MGLVLENLLITDHSPYIFKIIILILEILSKLILVSTHNRHVTSIWVWGDGHQPRQKNINGVKVKDQFHLFSKFWVIKPMKKKIQDQNQLLSISE